MLAKEKPKEIVPKVGKMEESKEKGIEDYIGRWRGFAVKKGTPQPIVKYLIAASEKSFNSAEYQKFLLEDVGHERPAWAAGKDFYDFVKMERDTFEELGKELKWIK